MRVSSSLPAILIPRTDERPPAQRTDGLSCAALWGESAQRSSWRRWRRCIATIAKPAPIRTMPKPMLQRRSKPVNGSVPLFSVSVVLVGVELVFEGEVSLVLVGVEVSFSGEVPVLGVVGVVGVVVGVVGGVGGVWLYPVVGSSAAKAAVGPTSAIVSKSASGASAQRREGRLLDRF